MFNKRDDESIMAPFVALGLVFFFLFFKLAFRFLYWNFCGVKEMFLEYYRTWKAKKVLKWLLSTEDKQAFIQEMQFHANVLGIDPVTWTVPQVEKAFRKNMSKFSHRRFAKYASDLSTPIQPKIQQLEQSYWFFKNEFEF